MSTVKTLDYLAAKTAHAIVETAKQHNAPKEIENVITKALGVLQAQGVYALYLYLYSQAEGDKPATYLLLFLWNELKDNEVGVPLPSQVKVVPLQDNGVLCEPRKMPGVRTFKDEERARQAREQANNCVQQIYALWEANKDKFEKPFEGTEEVFRRFQYELKEEEEKPEWTVQPNNSNLLKKFSQLPSIREIILANIRDLTADLDTLLLVRDLYEQTLVYARYHAKALG